jgi:hypothetical protein
VGFHRRESFAWHILRHRRQDNVVHFCGARKQI